MLSRVLPVLAQNMVTVVFIIGSIQTLKDLDAKIRKLVSDGLGPRVDEGPLRDAGGDSRLPDLLPAEVGVVLANRLPVAWVLRVQLLKVGEYLRHLIAEVVIWQHEHARLEADELAILLAGNVGVLRQQIFPSALRVAAVRAQSVIKQVDLQLEKLIGMRMMGQLIQDGQKELWWPRLVQVWDQNFMISFLVILITMEI